MALILRYSTLALFAVLLLSLLLPLIIYALPSASRTQPNGHDRPHQGATMESQKILPEALDSLGKVDPMGMGHPGDKAFQSSAEGFKRAAELFKASVNESVDPCEDFYEFSCGKWVSNNQIPDDLTSYGHFSELREKVNSEMKSEWGLGCCGMGGG